MAKSTKAKRQKKKDFLKKKIKVGKTLKKPQNETITTFKSRSIHIMEQLAEKEAGAHVTRKRYNMMELCTRLNHTSSNIKLDACSGVKELIGKLPSDEVRESLSSVVCAVSRCLLDNDCKLRTTAIKLLEAIIDKVGPSSLVPHYSLLGRHVSCGLVSLHNDVQEDALKMLQVLLDKAPQLLRLHAAVLVPNLLRMLGAKAKNGMMLQKIFSDKIKSSLESEDKPNVSPGVNNKKSKSKSKSSKSVNGKSVNNKSSSALVLCNSKQSGLVWQLNVFVVLTAILRHTVHDFSTEAQAPPSRFQVLLQSVSPSGVRHSSLRVAGDGVAECSRFVLLSCPTKLQDCCTALATLLHRLWRNMLPGDDKNRSGASLRYENGHCLMCLLDLEQVISKMVESCTGRTALQCSWYVAVITPILKDLLNNHFPFYYAAQAPQAKRANKKSKYEERPAASCDNLNVRLATAGVRYALCSERTISTMVQYLQDLLLSEDKIGSYDMQSACELVLSLVDYFAKASGSTESVSSHDDAVNTLLSSCLLCYQQQHPLKKQRTYLLNMLLSVTDADHKHILRLSSVRSWCQNLSAEVRESSSLPGSLLSTMLSLALRRCPGLTCQDQRHHQQLCGNLMVNGRDLTDEEKNRLTRLLL